ncbi:MAG: potassium transporter TrkH [Lachnospiraceae bacterium]|nr:potassium transporter TrkH [Lachnospiraceae bacterium]
MLPVSCSSGHGADVLTALFTATTSVCVTGLVVVDTYAYWSLFGQFVILLLIQIGGLGVVSVLSMIMIATGRKIFLSNRMLLGDSLNLDNPQGVLSFLIRMFKGVLIIELCGAILCSVKLIPMMGISKGAWAAVFQSVSAFCNAGMDVIGPDSMIGLRDSQILMWTTMILIVLGGIGFIVWFDIADGIRNAIRRRFSFHQFFSHLPEHTRVVILMTLFLITAGAILIFIFEYGNTDTLGTMSLKDKILNSFFQSITFRTAGFASIPQEHLTEGSCMIGYVLMFIGGSPIGTAGGIKTMTAFLFFINAFSYINGKKENVIFHRKVPEGQLKKAAAIVFFSMLTVFVMTLLLMTVCKIVHTDALYEVISALGTVGLSRGLTPRLNTIGRVIIIISMYLGRIGPISMAVFFAKEKKSDNSIEHAAGTFYVG